VFSCSAIFSFFFFWLFGTGRTSCLLHPIPGHWLSFFNLACASPQFTPLHVHVLPDGLSTLPTAELSPHWLSLIIDLRPGLHPLPGRWGMVGTASAASLLHVVCRPLCPLWFPKPESPLLRGRHPLPSGLSPTPFGWAYYQWRAVFLHAYVRV